MNSVYALLQGRNMRAVIATSVLLVAAAFLNQAHSRRHPKADPQGLEAEGAAQTHTLAFPAVRGDVGPFRQATLMMSLPHNDIASVPHGALIVTTTGGKTTALALPPFDEADGFFTIKINSVAFQNMDAQPDKEIIIHYTAQKTGPLAESYAANAFYKWAGQKFSRLQPAENTVLK
jgi:hypothetical protein